jgi:hypothetical protein
MNNLLSYCGLVDARIRGSDKDLPVTCCDKTLLEFDKEVFYKPATFHVSLAWVLGDQRDQIDIKNLQSCLEKFEESTFHVDSIYCKIGNKLYTSKL